MEGNWWILKYKHYKYLAINMALIFYVTWHFGDYFVYLADFVKIDDWKN